ncbi:MAG: superoxide dismutase [Opitutaceae bacterium]|jgi:superoxide dismutase, Fe-Mn family|nr:superoxide dismutase [Opitutaceae bacterium]
MKTPLALTRRDAMKTLGLGAVALGLGLYGRAEEVGHATKSAVVPPQPFTLPPLPYGYDALAPYIDSRTLELHHLKHHQGYIDSANRALAEFPELQKKTAEELLKNIGTVPAKIRGIVRDQVGGHVNHTLFWQVIGPDGGGAPMGPLAMAIDRTFGSLDAFRERFTDLAMRRFGSGWAWLVMLADGRVEVTSTVNQDSPLMAGQHPLLGVDVWEHAYYLQYQERRLDYLSAFWRVVNWRAVEANYAAARV